MYSAVKQAIETKLDSLLQCFRENIPSLLCFSSSDNNLGEESPCTRALPISNPLTDNGRRRVFSRRVGRPIWPLEAADDRTHKSYANKCHPEQDQAGGDCHLTNTRYRPTKTAAQSARGKPQMQQKLDGHAYQTSTRNASILNNSSGPSDTWKKSTRANHPNTEKNINDQPVLLLPQTDLDCWSTRHGRQHEGAFVFLSSCSWIN